MPFLLANWKLIALGGLALACAVLFGLWQWEKADFASFKLAQEKAVRKAQERADSLSTDLLIEQAKAYAVTEKKVVEYRERIRTAPDDATRYRIGTQAVRDIVGMGATK